MSAPDQLHRHPDLKPERERALDHGAGEIRTAVIWQPGW